MTTQYKDPEQIGAYINTDKSFVDYARFEGDVNDRKLQKDSFINGAEYAPAYSYSELDFLIDDKDLLDKKTALYEAVLELEAAKQAPNMNIAELELYSSSHELTLKKIMLVEAARDIKQSVDSSGSATARESFNYLNREVFGEFDTVAYQSMIATERERLSNFQPGNTMAGQVKKELDSLIDTIKTGGNVEAPLLSPEILEKLRSTVLERYANELAAVPETDDSIYYDVDACVDIMNDALERGGLAKEGWVVEHNPKKTAPATNAKSKKIFLPSNTRRSAAELRRLIVHEQEVHARRAQNGINTGSNLLQYGTADYADVEEGLGVIFECAVAGTMDNPSFDRARDRYITAGLALGTENEAPRDARQTFEVMWRLIAVREAVAGTIDDAAIASAKNKAYAHVENAFRGTNFTMRGVIYTKLKVYYEGLRKNAQFFADNSEDMNAAIDVAMVGKYNHTDPEECTLVSDSLNYKAAV